MVAGDFDDDVESDFEVSPDVLDFSDEGELDLSPELSEPELSELDELELEFEGLLLELFDASRLSLR